MAIISTILSMLWSFVAPLQSILIAISAAAAFLLGFWYKAKQAGKKEVELEALRKALDDERKAREIRSRFDNLDDTELDGMLAEWRRGG